MERPGPAADVASPMLRQLTNFVLGVPFELPPTLVARYPELARAHWRRGGVALRVGGWCLRRPTVSGITLWRTVSLAPNIAFDAELLLHELRHVDQFQCDQLFPLRYVWESLRHGYLDNSYEADAREFAARRIGGATLSV